MKKTPGQQPQPVILSKPRNYWPLALIALVFAMPMLLATLAHFLKDSISWQTTQHGNLIQPGVELNISPELKDGPTQWQVLYLTPQHCDSVCEARKDELARLHIALGVDQPRVSVHHVPAFQVRPTQDIGYNGLSFDGGSVFLVDPYGQAMMHYTKKAEGSGILKDLRKLLKYSDVGTS